LNTLYDGTAEFSEDMLHRYTLTRENLIPDCSRVLVDIGLNPSTATAVKDDRTVAKGTLYAISWGCSKLIKVNAYAYRTKDPKILFAAKAQGVDIVGPINDQKIMESVKQAVDSGGIVLAAWGGNIEPFRQEQLVELLKGVPLWCVKRNQDKWGTPKHYLYEKNSAQPTPWIYQPNKS
jgi:hypothetical protein